MKKKIATLLLSVLCTLPMMSQERYHCSDISIGYINKDWVTDFGNETYHENIFGQEGKRLHGVQVAYNYTTCLPVGLGLHTGLAYEWCMSYSDEVKERGFDRFNEHSLYLPVHATWHIPVSDDFSIQPYAGVGFNWKVSASFKSGLHTGMWTDAIDPYGRWDRYEDVALVRYGRNGWPHALNAQLEFGANLHISGVVVGFTYSRGLTDHEFYRKDLKKTRQDKIAVTLGFCIDSAK